MSISLTRAEDLALHVKHSISICHRSARNSIIPSPFALRGQIGQLTTIGRRSCVPTMLYGGSDQSCSALPICAPLDLSGSPALAPRISGLSTL